MAGSTKPLPQQNGMEDMVLTDPSTFNANH